jgi:hypothetical protein
MPQNFDSDFPIARNDLFAELQQIHVLQCCRANLFTVGSPLFGTASRSGFNLANAQSKSCFVGYAQRTTEMAKSEGGDR